MDTSTPVAPGIGMGERVARHAAAHVVAFHRVRSQARLDVAQSLAVSQLRKRQRQKLIQAREGLGLVLSLVTRDAALERRYV